MNHLTKTFVFAVVAFMLSGCGDDPRPASKLVGKWLIKDTYAEITVPGGDLRQYLIAQVGMGPEEADDYVIYLESGEGAEIDVATLEFKNDGSYESRDNDDLVLTGKWELSSDEKILTVDKGTTHELVIAINSMTDTNLIIKFDLSSSIGLPNLKYIVILTCDKM